MKCVSTVLNISVTVEMVALNAPMFAKDVQNIVKTVRDFFVRDADFVPIVQESFGAKTVIIVETVLMSAIVEQVALNVRMFVKVVLKNAVIVPKWIYARNVEIAETV